MEWNRAYLPEANPASDTFVIEIWNIALPQDVLNYAIISFYFFPMTSWSTWLNFLTLSTSFSSRVHILSCKTAVVTNAIESEVKSWYRVRHLYTREEEGERDIKTWPCQCVWVTKSTHCQDMSLHFSYSTVDVVDKKRFFSFLMLFY
jgi:hypothetical protein